MSEPAEITLLLTATVKPPSHVPIARTDPAVRLADYMRAIESWKANADPRIRSLVFAENSGAGQDELRAALKGLQSHYASVEYVDASPNEVLPNVHYGYAELAMIQRAFETSETLRNASHFVKATGRLIFPDIDRLIDQVRGDTKFIVDARDFKIWKHHRCFIPFQLACFSIPFFQARFLARRLDLQREHSGFETMLFKELIELKGMAGCSFRFARNCEPIGQAAHYSKDYRGIGRRGIILLRAVQRRLLPWLWI